MHGELSAVNGLFVGGEMIEIECRGPDARISFKCRRIYERSSLASWVSAAWGCTSSAGRSAPFTANAMPHVYTPRDILAAQLAGRSGIPLNDDTSVAETIADLLAFGSEKIYSWLKPGINPHISYLSLYACRPLPPVGTP